MLPKIVARPWQVPLFRIFYRFITLLQYETDYNCKNNSKFRTNFSSDHAGNDACYQLYELTHRDF